MLFTRCVARGLVPSSLSVTPYGITHDAFGFCVVIAGNAAVRVCPRLVIPSQRGPYILPLNIAFVNVVAAFFDEKLERKQLAVFRCEMRRRFVAENVHRGCMGVRSIPHQHLCQLDLVGVAGPRHGCAVVAAHHHSSPRIRCQPFRNVVMPSSRGPLQRIQTISPDFYVTNVWYGAIGFQTRHTNFVKNNRKNHLGVFDITQWSTGQ
mmetsp:Transcript_31590/g.74335  ORF Transcript_31590/g.74335 Transcript_31590/m.74335 type:complete len:207 (-) Transcript_31590:915-1535(-)